MRQFAGLACTALVHVLHVGIQYTQEDGVQCVSMMEVAKQEGLALTLAAIEIIEVLPSTENIAAL